MVPRRSSGGMPLAVTLPAMNCLRTMKPCTVEGSQQRAIEVSIAINTTLFLQPFKHPAEHQKQVRGGYRIEQRVDPVVGWYLVQTEDRSGIAVALTVLHRVLIGGKRRASGEKDRDRPQCYSACRLAGMRPRCPRSSIGKHSDRLIEVIHQCRKCNDFFSHRQQV